MLALEERQTEEQPTDDDDHVHYRCCDPDRALCGEDISGTPEAADYSDDDLCVECEIIDDAGLSCGRPFCRIRSWWRTR